MSLLYRHLQGIGELHALSSIYEYPLMGFSLHILLSLQTPLTISHTPPDKHTCAHTYTHTHTHTHTHTLAYARTQPSRDSLLLHHLGTEQESYSVDWSPANRSSSSWSWTAGRKQRSRLFLPFRPVLLKEVKSTDKGLAHASSGSSFPCSLLTVFRSRMFVCPLYQEWEGTDEDASREEVLEVGGF